MIKKLICGDCFDYLQNINADIIFTSPPIIGKEMINTKIMMIH